MHRGRRCLFFWYPSKDFPANQKDPRDGQWRCCCCWYTHAHARPDISLHPKSCILFCYGSSFTKRDLLFFFFSSWIVLVFKYKGKVLPSTVYYCSLHSSFFLPITMVSSHSSTRSSTTTTIRDILAVRAYYPHHNYCLLHRVYYSTTWCPHCGQDLK